MRSARSGRRLQPGSNSGAVDFIQCFLEFLRGGRAVPTQPALARCQELAVVAYNLAIGYPVS